MKLANTPNSDDLMAMYPITTTKACGNVVGLSKSQAGNNEVGHLSIGAGRIVYQSLTLINKTVEDGTFYKNEKFLEAIQHAKGDNSRLHIWGLSSNGGVHSSNKHIYALLKLAKDQGLEEVYVHTFLNGRGVTPDSGADFAQELQDKIDETGVETIASVSDRYYVMDRDKRTGHAELAYNALAAKGGEIYSNPIRYAKDSYAKDTSNEFVLPGHNPAVDGGVNDNDSIILANSRPDRTIRASDVFITDIYEDLKSADKPKNLEFVYMMKYADTVHDEAAFALPDLTNTLGDYLSSQDVKQLRIAETEKYAHIIFFFDDSVDKEIEGATCVLINSPKIATHDLQPEMGVYEVKDVLTAELDRDIHDVVTMSFANCDMVGHTGIVPVAIKAVSVVDEYVGEVYKKVLKLGGTTLITTDHGNDKRLLDEEDNPLAAHITDPVPLILTNTHLELKEGRELGGLVPTILQLLGLPIPEEMAGESLLG